MELGQQRAASFTSLLAAAWVLTGGVRPPRRRMCTAATGLEHDEIDDWVIPCCRYSSRSRAHATRRAAARATPLAHHGEMCWRSSPIAV